MLNTHTHTTNHLTNHNILTKWWHKCWISFKPIPKRKQKLIHSICLMVGYMKYEGIFFFFFIYVFISLSFPPIVCRIILSNLFDKCDPNEHWWMITHNYNQSDGNRSVIPYQLLFLFFCFFFVVPVILSNDRQFSDYVCYINIHIQNDENNFSITKLDQKMEWNGKKNIFFLTM